MNTQISMDYYPEGDMLSITFGAKGRKGRGYELNDYIYIRIDPSTYELLGLTILSYSKLLKLGEMPLLLWDSLKSEEQEIIRGILKSSPVNHFLSLRDDTVSIPVSIFQNPSIREIVAA